MPVILIVALTFLITTLFEAFIFFIQHRKYESSYNKEKKALDVARKIDKLLLQKSDLSGVMQNLANFLPSELNFATSVIVLYDDNKKVLRRVAASNTKEAAQAIKALSIPFTEIAIPIDEPKNLIARAIRERKEFVTSNVYDVFVPVLSQEESAKIQQIMSTKSTIIYPIYVEDKPLGVFVASSNKTIAEITEYEKDIISAFVDGAGIALQNSQLFSSLRELNKMKDEFVFIATHDLKTPVTAIDGYISLIEKEKPAFPEDIKENFESVKEASERLKQLVNDLLQVARGESGTIKVEVSKVDVKEIIEKIIKEVTPAALIKNVKINSQLDQDNKFITGDETKLPEIMENLLSNAIKFNRSGGEVTIITKKNNSMLEISVIDTGFGIPKAEESKVFEKFFKYRGDTTRDVPGTGLGLFVVKMLIEKMNGTISFTSVENKGTTFVFTLPLAI